MGKKYPEKEYSQGRKEKPAGRLTHSRANSVASPRCSLCDGTVELAVQGQRDFGQMEKVGSSNQLIRVNQKVLILACEGLHDL